uniref:Putative secreted protein n=1 Tax=Xenopsylla cheopis TaxID=163159 RepID=A0A6M2E3I8_XENCH
MFQRPQKYIFYFFPFFTGVSFIAISLAFSFQFAESYLHFLSDLAPVVPQIFKRVFFSFVCISAANML